MSVTEIPELTFEKFAELYCGVLEKTAAGLKATLRKMLDREAKYRPTGFVMMECQQMDSSYFGSRVIVPYGGESTWKDIPEGVVSPRGIASDMSIVIAILLTNELCQ